MNINKKDYQGNNISIGNTVIYSGHINPCVGKVINITKSGKKVRINVFKKTDWGDQEYHEYVIVGVFPSRLLVANELSNSKAHLGLLAGSNFKDTEDNTVIGKFYTKKL